MSRVLPGRNFASRFVELRFDRIGQLEPIFQKVVDPFSDRLDFGAWQFWNRCPNFFSRAHDVKYNLVRAVCQRGTLTANSHLRASNSLRLPQRAVDGGDQFFPARALVFGKVACLMVAGPMNESFGQPIFGEVSNFGFENIDD